MFKRFSTLLVLTLLAIGVTTPAAAWEEVFIYGSDGEFIIHDPLYEMCADDPEDCVPPEDGYDYLPGGTGGEIGAGDSTEGLGWFSATLIYTALSDTEAELSVTVSNLSAPENGGYITGFALNNPELCRDAKSKAIGCIERVTAAPGFPEGFQVLGGNNPFNQIKAPPYGNFDFGAALGGNFLGGGGPVKGVSTELGKDFEEFRFYLTGTDMHLLDEFAFVEAFSSTKKKNTPNFFVVRFKGFNDGGSDKVAGAQMWLGE